MSHTNIKVYGTNWCSDCKRSKKFLGEQRIHYDFINIEEDQEGQAFVQRVQNGLSLRMVHCSSSHPMLNWQPNWDWKRRPKATSMISSPSVVVPLH
jgi:glutaredoxin